MIEKIKTWIAGNKILAIAAGAIVALLVVRKMIARPVRRKRRTVSAGARKFLRRSAGRPKTKVKRVYTKGGKAKKPWQVKGSLAARRHMARLRKMR